MQKLFAAFVYTAFLMGANPALAEGGAEKLVLPDAPRPLPEAVLMDAAGAEVDLSSHAGHWLVLNFWATWCAPCREEMPSLLALQTARPDLRVLPIATGRNPPEQIARFYEKAGVTALPVLRDPTQSLAAPMGIAGLPVTVIVNPEGEEVARLIGGADWAAPAMLAALDALMK